MLTSLTPVGEAARHQRWGLTASAYIVGAVLGGSLLGTVLGAVGGVVRELSGLAATGPRLGVLGLLAAAGLAADLGLGGLWVPSPGRQVNERWLSTYRGWVYGIGFGVQLGLGLATRVTASIVPVAFAAALLVASWPTGLLVGAVFGAARALPLLATGRVRTPVALRRLGRRVAGLDPVAARATRSAQAALAGLAVLVAVGGVV